MHPVPLQSVHSFPASSQSNLLSVNMILQPLIYLIWLPLGHRLMTNSCCGRQGSACLPPPPNPHPISSSLNSSNWPAPPGPLHVPCLLPSPSQLLPILWIPAPNHFLGKLPHNHQAPPVHPSQPVSFPPDIFTYLWEDLIVCWLHKGRQGSPRSVQFQSLSLPSPSCAEACFLPNLMSAHISVVLCLNMGLDCEQFTWPRVETLLNISCYSLSCTLTFLASSLLPLGSPGCSPPQLRVLQIQVPFSQERHQLSVRRRGQLKQSLVSLAPNTQGHPGSTAKASQTGQILFSQWGKYPQTDLTAKNKKQVTEDRLIAEDTGKKWVED